MHDSNQVAWSRDKPRIDNYLVAFIANNPFIVTLRICIPKRGPTVCQCVPAYGDDLILSIAKGKFHSFLVSCAL